MEWLASYNTYYYSKYRDNVSETQSRATPPFAVRHRVPETGASASNHVLECGLPISGDVPLTVGLVSSGAALAPLEILVLYIRSQPTCDFILPSKLMYICDALLYTRKTNLGSHQT